MSRAMHAKEAKKLESNKNNLDEEAIGKQVEGKPFFSSNNGRIDIDLKNPSQPSRSSRDIIQ